MRKLNQLFCNHWWVEGPEAHPIRVPMPYKEYLKKDHIKRIILIGCRKCGKVRYALEVERE